MSPVVAPRGVVTLPGQGTQGGPGVTPTQGMEAGDSAFAVAQQQLGKPYVYGSAGPDSFDCSGLTYYSYNTGPHINIGRDTSSQWNSPNLNTIYDAVTGGTMPTVDQLQVGDLLYYFAPGNSGTQAHVMMYGGGGQSIEAPYTGQNVRMTPVVLGNLDAGEPFRGIKRSTGGGSSGGGSGSGSGSGNNPSSQAMQTYTVPDPASAYSFLHNLPDLGTTFPSRPCFKARWLPGT